MLARNINLGPDLTTTSTNPYSDCTHAETPQHAPLFGQMPEPRSPVRMTRSSRDEYTQQEWPPYFGTPGTVVQIIHTARLPAPASSKHTVPSEQQWKDANSLTSVSCSPSANADTLGVDL